MTRKLYQNVAPIDRNQHGAHRLKRISRFDFAAAAQTLPLVGAEFFEAHKEYPIVFVSIDSDKPDELIPVALLGLEAEQNLYVAADGSWDARYIPAFLRRYPFIFAETGPDQLTVCVDTDYEGFGETEGEALFDGENPSPFLSGILDLLNDYQQQARLTQQFIQRLKEYDLLTEQALKAEVSGGREFVVNGFWSVDEAKLRALDPIRVQGLFANGELALIYAHLMSLSNVAALVDRMARNADRTVH